MDIQLIQQRRRRRDFCGRVELKSTSLQHARLTVSDVSRRPSTQASHGYTTSRAASGQIRGESGVVGRRLATSSFVVELRGGVGSFICT